MLCTAPEAYSPKNTRPSPAYPKQKNPRIECETLSGKNETRRAGNILQTSVSPARNDGFSVRVTVLNKLIHIRKLYSA